MAVVNSHTELSSDLQGAAKKKGKGMAKKTEKEALRRIHIGGPVEKKKCRELILKHLHMIKL